MEKFLAHVVVESFPHLEDLFLSLFTQKNQIFSLKYVALYEENTSLFCFSVKRIVTSKRQENGDNDQ